MESSPVIARRVSQLIPSHSSKLEINTSSSSTYTNGDPSIAPTPTSSSPPSSVDTPSFTPNSPPYNLPPDYVTLKTVLASLSRENLTGPPTLDDVIVPDLDLELPISSLLRIGTSRAHVRAENSDGAGALVKGDLTLQEYIRWLVILWRVYSALELGLSEHANHPALSPTYNPQVLARAPALARDITYLLTLLPPMPKPKTVLKPPEDAPLPPFPVSDFLMPVFTLTPPPLATYITHLRDLALSSADAPLLLAHSYVRYLGDLSGGQYIASKTKKAFGLKGDQGMEFYKFEMEGAEGPMRTGHIKDWFRDGMNAGVHDDEVLKERLVKEANLAFALNVHLFALIRQPSLSTNASTPSTPAKPGAQPVDLTGQHLRYYERRQMEQEAKARTKMLTNGHASSSSAAKAPRRTWRESIERFSIFALAVGVTMGFSQYGWPWMQQEVIPRVKELSDRYEIYDKVTDAYSSWKQGSTATAGKMEQQVTESVISAASAVTGAAGQEAAEALQRLQGVNEDSGPSETASPLEIISSTLAEQIANAASSVSTLVGSATEIIGSAPTAEVMEAAEELFEDITTSAENAVPVPTDDAAVTDVIADEASVILDTVEHVASEIGSTVSDVISESVETAEEIVTEWMDTATATVTATSTEEEPTLEASAAGIPVAEEQEPSATVTSTPTTTPAPDMEVEEARDDEDVDEGLGSKVETTPSVIPDVSEVDEEEEDDETLPLDTPSTATEKFEGDTHTPHSVEEESAAPPEAERGYSPSTDDDDLPSMTPKPEVEPEIVEDINSEHVRDEL